MARRLRVGLLATGLLLVAAPAYAQPPITPPVTKVIIQKNLVETLVQALPSCKEGGPLYTNTTTSNHVERTTTFDDGRSISTLTATGTGRRTLKPGAERCRARPKVPKLLADPVLARAVTRDLRAGYSPAGTAVRLREAGGSTVSHETIYRPCAHHVRWTRPTGPGLPANAPPVPPVRPGQQEGPACSPA